jgi:hypothetical protein
VSSWILYDDFVDLVRNHHHNAFSGLITGVSDSNHSFQIGFDHGKIVLLTYRVKKGAAALHLMSQIERAKISEHPNADIHEVGGEVPNTGLILSELTAQTLDETTTMMTDISNLPSPRQTSVTSSPRSVDARLRQIIERAAIHHFGPIGAMVCEDHLVDPRGDVKAIMLEIAQEVGASESDTSAFFDSVSEA